MLRSEELRPGSDLSMFERTLADVQLAGVGQKTELSDLEPSSPRDAPSVQEDRDQQRARQPADEPVGSHPSESSSEPRPGSSQESSKSHETAGPQLDQHTTESIEINSNATATSAAAVVPPVRTDWTLSQGPVLNTNAGQEQAAPVAPSTMTLLHSSVGQVEQSLTSPLVQTPTSSNDGSGSFDQQPQGHNQSFASGGPSGQTVPTGAVSDPRVMGLLQGTAVAEAPGGMEMSARSASPLAALTEPPQGLGTQRSVEKEPVNHGRIVRALRSALNQKGGNITLRLSPPQLGTVRINLQLQGTVIAAQFHAETEAGRSILHQQLAQLRVALEGQGLSVERLGVQSMTASNQGSVHQHAGQQSSDESPSEGRSRGAFTGQGGQQQDRNSQSDPHRKRSFEDVLLNQVA